MNNIWYIVILFALLLMLVLAPFVGLLAPLLLIFLIAGAAWFFRALLKSNDK